MTPPNTPKNDIETPKIDGKSRKNLFELLDETIEARIFQDLHNEAALLEKLQHHPTDIQSEIRSDMRQRLINSPGQYSDFTEVDINNPDKISNKTILEKFNLLLVSTSRGQDRLKKRVLSMFSKETFNPDLPNGADNLRDLENWIKNQNEKDIQKLLKFPIQLRKRLQRECFGNRLDTFVSQDSLFFLNRIGLSERDLTDVEKETMAQISNGVGTLAPAHIQTYLKIIERGTVNRSDKLKVKKDILREFLPTITPILLVQYGIITKAQAREKVKKGLEATFGDTYFDTGSADEKHQKQQFLDGVYRRGEYVEVDIDEYLHDDNFVDQLLSDSEKRRTKLVEQIEEAVKDMQTEHITAQFDMDGMEIKPDLQGNWHQSFVDNISNLKEGASPKVKNAHLLKEGAYIRITQNQGDKKGYAWYRVTKTDVEVTMPSDIRDKNGDLIKHRGLQMEDWTQEDGMVTPGQQGNTMMEYAKLWTLFKDPNSHIEILSDDEVQARRQPSYTGEDKIYTPYDEGSEFSSIDTVSEALGWQPKKGHIYTTQDAEGGNDYYVEILDIDEARGTVRVSDGIETHALPFATFFKFAKEMKLKEEGIANTRESISSLFAGLKGFDGVFVDDDGILKRKSKDKHGKEIKVPIHHFLDEEGEGMYLTGLGNGGGTATFGKIKNKDKDWSEMKGKVNLKPFKSNCKNLSIVGILNQLRANGYQPYENPKDQPGAPDPEDHLPHMHGTFFGKIMNWMSFSDMKRGFDLYIHAWEHKMEKNSKFQAAKFANEKLKKFMPESVAYQLRSEAYAAQNEAMEGILKMLENDMSGKEARLYIRKKILLNEDAKFEEVLAGLLYISKKTGQLYPEELSDLKNSEIWFYKLTTTQGYKSKADRAFLRKKCVEKTDKAAAGVDAVSEMDIVERLLKRYEGEGKRIPPNIAPKFPGALVEGKKGNFEKGELEIAQRTNISQINKYALSKLNVGEGWKVMGCIDRIQGKNGSPTEVNAIPFTLLMSNMPEYMGSELRKEIHSRGTSLNAQHAFKFGNELSYVNNYRNVVMLAAKEVDRRYGSSAASKLAEIEAKRSDIGDESHSEETEGPQKEWINSIYEFWMEYGDKLQPILQMTDTFISAEANAGNKECEKYETRFNMLSAMQNGQWQKIHEAPNVTEGNMTPDHTPFHFTNLVHAVSQDINGQDGQLRNPDSSYGKIFRPGILGALEKLKHMDPNDVPPGADYRKVQYARFREYYAALVYYFRKRAASTVEMMFGASRSGKQYGAIKPIKDLQNYGLDFTVADLTRGQSSTTPAGVEITQESDFAKTYLDPIDEVRCKSMFENFIHTSASVSYATRSQIGSTIDYSQFGG